MDMKSISQKLQDDIRAIMEAGLHPNQQKIDVHEPEKDKITAHDFKKLRAMKKGQPGKITKEDTDWVIIEQDEDNTTAKVAGHKVTLHRSLSEPGISDTYTLHHPSGDKKVKISYDTHGDGEEVHGDKVNHAFGLDSKHKLGHKIAGSMSGMGGISKFEESVEQTNEEEKKKIVSPFDYKNYTSQIPKKPGELTGHDSKKTSTGTVYTKKPVKEEVELDEAANPTVKEKVKKALLKHHGKGTVTFSKTSNGGHFAQHEDDEFGDTHSHQYDPKTGKVEPHHSSSSYYEEVELDEGSGPKEKQKTPFRNINGPEYKAAADKQRQQMAKDKAAEPGKKMMAKPMKEDSVPNEYTFADYLEAARAQYVDEDAVLVANEAFKNQDITLFSDQSQSPEA